MQKFGRICPSDANLRVLQTMCAVLLEHRIRISSLHMIFSPQMMVTMEESWKFLIEIKYCNCHRH